MLLAIAPVPAPAQQGNAEAIVVKIPAASMPSTVILSGSNVFGAPGHSVSIPIALSPGGAAAPGSFQIDLTFDPARLTFVSATGLSSTAISAGDVRLSGVGPNAIPAGLVGAATFTLANSFGASTAAVSLVNCRSADSAGNPLSTGCIAATVGLLTCTSTGDASASVADVQAMINQALGIATAAYDMNEDGVVNVVDVERVLTAALGGACIF